MEKSVEEIEDDKNTAWLDPAVSQWLQKKIKRFTSWVCG